jgi:hypothetical protein
LGLSIEGGLYWNTTEEILLIQDEGHFDSELKKIAPYLAFLARILAIFFKFWQVASSKLVAAPFCVRDNDNNEAREALWRPQSIALWFGSTFGAGDGNSREA